MKTWRLMPQSGDDLSEPMQAADLVARMLKEPGGSFWLESAEGTGEFAEEVAEVRSLLFQRHLPEVAAAWFGRNGADASGWVFSFVFGLCREAPEEAVKLVRALVAEAQTDQELVNVGAGPLEALLRQRGPEAISAVEVAAKDDARFRLALAGVWPSEQHPDVWKRWTAALGEQKPV